MLTVLLAFLLFSCAGNTDRAKNGVKITATDAKTEQTEEYNDAVFSMTIPKGWKVTYSGSDIYHSIRISDPDEPLNCMFVLLKADCLLHSQEGKDAWKAVYNEGNRDAVIFANAPVLEKPSTESFLRYLRNMQIWHQSLKRRMSDILSRIMIILPLPIASPPQVTWSNIRSVTSF